MSVTEQDAAAFGRLFEAEEAGLAVLDTQGRIRVASPALWTMCAGGRAPDPGEEAGILFAAEDRAAVAGVVAAALAGPPAPPAVPARLANPALPADAAVEVFCRPLRGEPGALMRVVDVTARRRMQRQLEEGARLQTVGQLAGGVAHDFNNLLAVISGAAESALAQGADGMAAEDLRRILDAAGRGARLVRQLLAFASRQALTPQVIALGDVVAAMEPLLRQVCGARHAMVLEAPRPGPSVRVDLSQLDQLLVNLVVNAREAMRRGGRVSVSIAETLLAGDMVAQGSVIPPGSWAVVTVADEGRGIPPEILPRIFEPFFTTRRDAGGTGLGLSTVLGIMRQSGGHVSVESRPGQGTAFRLWFPPAQAAPEAAAPAKAARPAARSTALRVLLVDDEPHLRELVRRALAAAGHTVRAAEDAEAALEALAEGFEPEVLVSDVTMPGEMDGIALAEAVRARLPWVSVVLVSGYSEKTVGDGLAGRGFRFLEKPFRMAELVAAVGGAG